MSVAILREVGKPFMVKDVTEEMMRRYGILNPTRRQYDTVWSLVNSAFQRHLEAGKMIDANPGQWEAIPLG